ncbi:MAG: formylglycine-generating enzyme family protein, partial [Jaaginema sp. PMC 1079.18]|nr:formylglycine-generating enzyme family protein [Jaaginema sp. PMC 1080.18]MEC4852738.1 formylglycine-generating enzyme family protein [Jaaginema sp. PMC 1079.18]
PVGNFPPNSFGLYDMHGNIWEWCADPGPLHNNYEGAPQNGQVWDEDCNDNRYENYVQYMQILNNRLSCVIRGGSWTAIPKYCRSAFRLNYDLVGRHSDMGFRVAHSASLNP